MRRLERESAGQEAQGAVRSSCRLAQGALIMRLSMIVKALSLIADDLEWLISHEIGRYRHWPTPTTLRRLAAQLNTLADDIEAWSRRQGIK